MLGVPESECHAKESRVTHGKSRKSLTFAEIVSSGKANKTWTPAGYQNDHAEDGRSI